MRSVLHVRLLDLAQSRFAHAKQRPAARGATDNRLLPRIVQYSRSPNCKYRMGWAGNRGTTALYGTVDLYGRVTSHYTFDCTVELLHFDALVVLLIVNA